MGWSHLRIRVGAAVGLALMSLALAATAGAQDRPASIFIGATAIGPLSGTADRFSIGFGVDAGASFTITEQISIRGDWVFGHLGGAGDWPQPPLSVAFDTKLRTQFATVDVVFAGPPARAQLYVMGGVGVYFRTVDVTGISSERVAVCDPWWFVCSDGEVSSAQVAGSRSHTSFGVNVGAGVRVGRFFVEGRYHYAGGPTFETPVGRQAATGKFFPVTVGVVF